MRWLSVKPVPHHKASSIVPELSSGAMRASVVVNLMLAAIMGLLARPAQAQVADPLENCAHQLSGPPISEIEFHFGAGDQPTISEEDANLFVGLECSRDQIIEFFESYGWKLTKYYELGPNSKFQGSGNRFVFCYPRPWWKRFIHGRCSVLLVVTVRNGEIFGVGIMGVV